VAASQVLDQNTVDLIRQLSISMCPYSGVMVITHAVKINLVHSGRWSRCQLATASKYLVSYDHNGISRVQQATNFLK